jgi:site-specific DNA-methyltransferase (adenine-specific)
VKQQGNVGDWSETIQNELPINEIVCGDAAEQLRKFPDECIDFCMTSPPYWGLRDYGIKGQFGLEQNFREYISELLEVFDQLQRVLKSTGSFYLNLGDTYSRGDTIPAKCMIGIPWRVALALVDEGWILRNAICWYRANSMPASVKDRLSNTYEHIFHFVKSKKYYYNLDAIREPHSFEPKPFNIRVRDAQKGRLHSKWGVLAHASEREVKAYDEQNYTPKYPHERRHFQLLSMGIGHGGHTGKTVRHDHPLGKNPGDLWTVNSKQHPFAHFAVYPEEICVRPILSSCPEKVCTKCGMPQLPTGDSCKCGVGFRPGIVMDMFAGSGTTLVVAKKLGRDFVGIELNLEYVKIARQRLAGVSRPITASLV